ncbi:MAG TPA: hypothetical protein VIL07_02555 [Symbiobacteriaceae bacterium]
MQKRLRWLQWTAAVVLTGALLAPQAVAAAEPAAPAPVEAEAAKPQESLTPAQKEVLKQIRELRKQYRQKLQAESRELVEKAVKEGKLSRQEADQLLKHIAPRRLKPPRSVKEMKARLDEAVRAGKLTREQADQILQHWKESHEKKGRD